MRCVVIVLCVLVLLPGVVFGQAGRVIYPTLPGTDIRDYRKPGWVVDGRSVYPTLPGSDVRDYRRGGYVVKDGGTLYPTLPGTDIRDFTQPGFTLQDPWE